MFVTFTAEYQFVYISDYVFCFDETMFNNNTPNIEIESNIINDKSKTMKQKQQMKHIPTSLQMRTINIEI